jgi:hypothetical protein
MNEKLKEEITRISKEFASAFGPINGSGWLIVDPLSGYLNHIGHENKLDQLPATDKHPQVLIMTFKDGSQLIPAGGDLKKIHSEAENWMWI